MNSACEFVLPAADRVRSTRHSTLCSFILKAVGPGLVVPAMFQLQKTGLGKDQGEGSRNPNMILVVQASTDAIGV